MSYISYVKRKIFLLLAMLCGTLYLWANPITPEQAKQIAFKQLQNSAVRSAAPLQLSYTRTTKAAPSLRSAGGASSENLYYIFNRGEKDGFVIVAADDRAPAVLAYSDAGHFDMDNLPEQAAWFITRYDNAMSQIISGAVAKGTLLRAGKIYGEPVSPLLDIEGIKWDQGSPYNDACPFFGGGQRAYTGCVATALAQILRFHKFPAISKGSITYNDGITTRSMTFGKKPYDWKNMLPEYKKYGVGATQAQKDAVAQLMVEVGFATRMVYAIDNFGSSGTQTQYLPQALVEHFNCSPSVRLMNRYSYPDDEFKSTIYNELKNNRPVFYSGKAENAGGGHAFVCDGYSKDGLFHFNWGWGGVANGYFRLESLSPELLGTGAGNGYYSGCETIVVNIKEKKSDSEPVYYAKPDAAVRFKQNNDKTVLPVSFYLINASAATLTGDLTIALVNGENPLGTINRELQPARNISYPLYHEPVYNVTATSTGLADGTYCITALWKPKGDTQYRLMETMLDEPLYVIVKVQGGQFTDVKYDTPLDDISVVEDSFNSDLNAFSDSWVSVKLKNSGTRLYYGLVKLFYQYSNKANYTLEQGVTYQMVVIPGNTTSEFKFNIPNLDCPSDKKVTFKMELPTLNKEKPTSIVGYTTTRLNNTVRIGRATPKAVTQYNKPTYVATSNVANKQPAYFNLASPTPCNATFTITNMGTKGVNRQLIGVLSYKSGNNTFSIPSQNIDNMPYQAGASIQFTPMFSQMELERLKKANVGECLLSVKNVFKYGKKYKYDEENPIMGDHFRKLYIIEDAATGNVQLVNEGSCYPNPANAQTTVTYGAGVTSIDLFDLNGVMRASYSPNADGKTVIDTSMLENGNYVISLRSGNSAQAVMLQVAH